MRDDGFTDRQVKNDAAGQSGRLKRVGKRPRLAVGLIVVVAISLIGISFYFEISRVRLPSDGVHLSPSEAVWTERGARVTPLTSEDGNLREGDVVIAVGGHRLPDLFERMATFRPIDLNWKSGAQLSYTVLREGSQRQVPVKLADFDFLSSLKDGWGIIFAGTLNLIVFTVLFIKRTYYSPAQALFLAAVGLFTTRVWAWGLSIPDLIQGSGFWIYQITSSSSYFLIFSGGLHFALTFPSMAPVIKTRRWLIPAIHVFPNLFYWITFAVLWGTSAGTLDWMNTLGYLTSFIPLAYLVGILGAVIAGYRANQSREHRTRVRWVVYAVVIVTLFGLAFYVLPEVAIGKSLISANELSVVSLLVTVDILIAIYRYQIFDIDIIINRTAVYTVLSVCLGVIYLSGVSVFGSVLRSLSPAPAESAGIESPLTVVSSTLMVVVLFTPLRDRIQDQIDRSFYRTKYDAAQTLAQLNRSIQDVVELEDLIGVITGVVEDTLRPEFTVFQIEQEPSQRGRS